MLASRTIDDITINRHQKRILFYRHCLSVEGGNVYKDMVNPPYLCTFLSTQYPIHIHFFVLLPFMSSVPYFFFAFLTFLKAIYTNQWKVLFIEIFQKAIKILFHV